MARARLRVFLADDHPVVLSGIRALVQADPELLLIGEAPDGPAALAQVIALRPDVVVLDVSMPGLSGIEVARAVLAVCPTCRVLMLTVHEDRSYLRQLLQIGVAGYVLKRSAAEELARAIHVVASGGTHLDPAIARLRVAHGPLPAADLPAAGESDELSPRETEVLQLTAAGHSNKTISDRLLISVKTVDTYKARAMAKLGFESRVELIRHALSRGWLSDL